MTESLAEYLKGKTPGPFRIMPCYFIDGDFLTVYFEDADCYTEDLEPGVAIARAMDGNRIVGVKVYGVSDLVRKAFEAMLRPASP